jgi:hypothetical protein
VLLKGELYFLAKDNVEAVSSAVKNLETMTGYSEGKEKGIIMPAYNSRAVAVEISIIKDAVSLIDRRLKELALQKKDTTVTDAEMGELTGKFTDARAKLERMEDYAYARIFLHSAISIMTNEYSTAFDRLERLKGKLSGEKKFYSTPSTQFTLNEKTVQENLKIAALEMQLSMLEAKAKAEGKDLDKINEARTAMTELVVLYTSNRGINPGYEFKAKHYIGILESSKSGQSENGKPGQEPDSPAPAPSS